jgi:hypothetical protein
VRCRDCGKVVSKKGRHGAKPNRCEPCGIIRQVEKRLGAYETVAVLATVEEQRKFMKKMLFAATYGAGPSKIIQMIEGNGGMLYNPPHGLNGPTIPASVPAGSIYTIVERDDGGSEWSTKPKS